MSTGNSIGWSRSTGRYDLATPHDRRASPAPEPDDTRFCNRLYNGEISRVICSTNAIESLNARHRRAVKARGHFPTEQAAMKCLYLVTRSLDPKGTGQTRWATRWKPALNAFAITFADRMPTKAN